jgi:HD-like signal output (HDOD) protein
MQYWGFPQLLVDCASKHHEAVHDGCNRYATHLIYLASHLSQYVPPLDEQETRDILDDIDNWDLGQLSLEQIGNACQQADDLVFEVMESLGMVSIEIGND